MMNPQSPSTLLSLRERDRCWREILLILDAKSCAQPHDFHGFGADHWRTLRTKDKQVVLFDNPYIWSESLDLEPQLISKGWRVLHLPLHMAWYTAGKCQPRLLAPPGSSADLPYLQLLLETAGFKGNFALTNEFILGGHKCGGAAWQKQWAAEIAASQTAVQKTKDA